MAQIVNTKPDNGPESQRPLIAWLSSPAAHGLDARKAVERVETHASVVFLAGQRAWKLKRAVRYDYFDYSTPARRRHYLLEELRLNRRTAPSIYRAVRAVRQTPDGAYRIDSGTGRAVDYLLEMRQFDPATQFDRLAERGALDLALMAPLADAMARLHETATPRRDHGGAGAMRRVIEGNRDGLAAYGAGALDGAACTRLAESSLTLLDRLGARLDARRADGFVRHCHGDLHLRNICLVDGETTIFDCIEFDDAFSCIDTWYDGAFLVMDLLDRGLGAHANAVLNRYLDRTGDIDGITLLPLFLSVRAAVRAKICATAATLQTDSANAAGLRDAARSYLELALSVMEPGAPRVLAIGGISGSGKTTLARRLAPGVGPAPGAVVLRSDIERKRLFGVPPERPLGPEGYTTEANQRVYATLLDRARAIIDAGHGVIVDAVWPDPKTSGAIEAVARDAGVPFTGLWLDAPLETLARRLAGRRRDASEATADVAARQAQRVARPASWVRLDASGGVDAVAAAARSALR
ncbi:MAG: AAA family ATPase [Acidobacteria bacterium]|nr:AAA family ATPase [Acidobacteriota bacterium]